MFTQLGAIKMNMNINSSRGGDQPLSITDCRCSSADQIRIDAVHSGGITGLSNPDDSTVFDTDVPFNDTQHRVND